MAFPDHTNLLFSLQYVILPFSGHTHIPFGKSIELVSIQPTELHKLAEILTFLCSKFRFHTFQNKECWSSHMSSVLLFTAIRSFYVRSFWLSNCYMR